jgi:aldehyde:ferredoxin oxidoreductase
MSSTQKSLFVDLSSGSVATEIVPKDITDKLIGGRGVGAYYLYKLVKPGIDPLGPDNVIILSAGALAGTTAPCSGRTTLTCKSPVTNLYLKSSAGGHWSGELRYAGYEYLIITGTSPKPVYIWIDDDKVEIRDARHIWGSDTRETNRLIKEELGDPEIQIALIGPAGENKVSCASVNFSHHSMAGRGGTGAVMGSKNLKAIAVRGHGSVSVANPQAYYDLTQQVRRELYADPPAVELSMYGTSGMMPAVNDIYAVNNRNFQNNHADFADKLSGQYLVEKGYLTGRVSCLACSEACHRYVVNKAGKFGGVDGAGPEWEAMVALGVGPDISDTEAVLKANETCNLLGMDVISAGSISQWAMETHERGLFTKDDLDGVDLIWGNGEALVATLEKIARREGRLGELLAKGVKRASEAVGGESWKWAVQAKGLEQSCVETRSAKSYALAFAVNPRGPDHLMTETLAEFGGSAQALAVIKEATGSEEYASPYLTEKRAEIVRWHEDVYGLTEALGLCAFATTLAYAVNPTNMTAMYNAASGRDISREEAMLVGRRMVTLERCFNVREGARREHDVLPWRLMHDQVKSGPRAGAINSPEELAGMLDEYYKLHEWDVRTSVPKVKTLRKLGLDKICRPK